MSEQKNMEDIAIYNEAKRVILEVSNSWSEDAADAIDRLINHLETSRRDYARSAFEAGQRSVYWNGIDGVSHHLTFEQWEAEQEKGK